MPASEASDGHSFNSFASSLSGRSFFGKLNKYELKRKFYEKLEDFKRKVLVYKEPGIVVYRARCAYSGGIVVLKGYSRDTLTMQNRQRIWSEVQLLQTAHCPFMLKCFDAFEDQGWWWLVLENCACGDLYRIMNTGAPGVREEGWLVSQVLLPLLQTLAYLHNEGIIHRDVKPEHVLFNSEKVAKLSGFFLAQDVTKFGFPKDMVGSLDYVAPEVVRLTSADEEYTAKVKAGQAPGSYDYKVDVWQVGVLTYDALVGRPPFANEDPAVTASRVLQEDPEFPDEVSDDAADFILCCLSKEPGDRPTARQLLSHPWVRSNIAWTPPPGFDDPVPDMDWGYYEGRRGGGGRGDGEDGSDGDNSIDPDAVMEEDEGGPRVKLWDPRTWWGRGRQDPLADVGGRGFMGDQSDAQGLNPPAGAGFLSIARNLLGSKPSGGDGGAPQAPGWPNGAPMTGGGGVNGHPPGPRTFNMGPGTPDHSSRGSRPGSGANSAWPVPGAHASAIPSRLSGAGTGAPHPKLSSSGSAVPPVSDGAHQPPSTATGSPARAPTSAMKGGRAAGGSSKVAPAPVQQEKWVPLSSAAGLDDEEEEEQGIQGSSTQQGNSTAAGGQGSGAAAGTYLSPRHLQYLSPGTGAPVSPAVQHPVPLSQPPVLGPLDPLIEQPDDCDELPAPVTQKGHLVEQFAAASPGASGRVAGGGSPQYLTPRTVVARASGTGAGTERPGIGSRRGPGGASSDGSYMAATVGGGGAGIPVMTAAAVAASNSNRVSRSGAAAPASPTGPRRPMVPRLPLPSPQAVAQPQAQAGTEPEMVVLTARDEDGDDGTTQESHPPVIPHPAAPPPAARPATTAGITSHQSPSPPPPPVVLAAMTQPSALKRSPTPPLMGRGHTSSLSGAPIRADTQGSESGAGGSVPPASPSTLAQPRRFLPTPVPASHEADLIRRSMGALAGHAAGEAGGGSGPSTGSTSDQGNTAWGAGRPNGGGGGGDERVLDINSSVGAASMGPPAPSSATVHAAPGPGDKDEILHDQVSVIPAMSDHEREDEPRHGQQASSNV